VSSRPIPELDLRAGAICERKIDYRSVGSDRRPYTDLDAAAADLAARGDDLHQGTLADAGITEQH